MYLMSFLSYVILSFSLKIKKLITCIIKLVLLQNKFRFPLNTRMQIKTGNKSKLKLIINSKQEGSLSVFYHKLEMLYTFINLN